MTHELVISARGLPGLELESMLKSAANGSEITIRTSAETDRERAIDPTVAIAVIEAVSVLLVPFVAALAARLFQKEPDAKLEVAQPSLAEAVAPSLVTVIVASQSPKERERLLALHLPQAAAVEIVLPE
jgi:hypothetical protein